MISNSTASISPILGKTPSKSSKSARIVFSRWPCSTHSTGKPTESLFPTANAAYACNFSQFQFSSKCRTHKTPGAHYETGSTRMFMGGRTETIRSCSEESIRFAQAMLDCNVSEAAKARALLQAINAHKEYTLLVS